MLKSPIAPPSIVTPASSAIWVAGIPSLELVEQSEFNSSSGWGLGVGWTISGGKANQDGTGTRADYLSRNLTTTLVPDTVYNVSITIGGTAPETAVRADFVVADDLLGTGAETLITILGLPAGTYTGTFIPVNPHTIVLVAYEGAGAVTIDNLRIWRS